MPRQELIDMKIKRILVPMIKDLKTNEKVVQRVGGTTVRSFGKEIEFQEERKANLEWAATVTDEDIKSKIAELEGALTPEELDCKYGTARGLDMETTKSIAFIEDLEIALGTHPGVK